MTLELISFTKIIQDQNAQHSLAGLVESGSLEAIPSIMLSKSCMGEQGFFMPSKEGIYSSCISPTYYDEILIDSVIYHFPELIRELVSDMYSIIIPAYNEEGRIKSVLQKYATEFAEEEIIVVCDGMDHTSQFVRETINTFQNIRLLEFRKRLGKGGAIIEGFKAARGDLIGFADADESVSPDELRSMFENLGKVNGVIASRRLASSKIIADQPINRRFASRCFNLLVKNLFGLRYKDTQCGAKVFKREAIYDILGEMETRGFEFDVELLWRLRKKGYTILEYPVIWSHSKGSKFRMSQSFGMLLSLLRIRIR